MKFLSTVPTFCEAAVADAAQSFLSIDSLSEARTFS